MAVRGDSTLPNSGIFSIKNQRINLLLKKDCLSWEIENVPKSQTVIPLSHLIAVTLCDCNNFNSAKSLQCFYCRLVELRRGKVITGQVLPAEAKYMRVHYAVPSGRHMWKLKTHLFKPIENTSLKQWMDFIQDALSDFNRPKRLLIFINPYGGKRRGVKIYERKVLPILHLAGIEAHAVVTQRPNHARDVIQEVDILKYDGVICVGGDGMFSEVLNSIVLKTQQEKGVDANDIYNTLVIPRIPLGIIPAGSTNATVNCITGSCDARSSTLLIVMGEHTGIDVCGVYCSGRISRFAISFLSYGYFGDVLRDSEKFRWMGPKRYDYSGFKTLLRHKLYEGELHLQIDVEDVDSCLSERDERCRVNCEVCKIATQLPRYENESSKHLRWMTVRGRFMAVNAAVMSCTCRMTPEGISPSQHLGNGLCDVIVVSSCSRLDYLRYLFRTSKHLSHPFDLRFVRVYRVKEFRFNPHVTEDKTPIATCGGLQENWQELSSSIWNCDGEMINEPAITARVHCQLVNVFGRGYEDRKDKSSLSQCLAFMKKH